MPSTAVATGQVDFILPPEQIALELAKISRHPYVARPDRTTTVEEPKDCSDALTAIFAMLRNATKVDFTYYKRSTVNRRLGRRMLLYKLERLEDYVRYLRDHPAEIKALYQELLISVTNFFRDPEAFVVLKQQVFPTIAQGKSVESPIRIWVPGCATGEEVYSIAICLLEFLEGMTRLPPFQIFATDISETAIDTARAGIYKQSQMADVSPERLRRFFIQVEGGYQISKVIRERCVFARQNMILDPPFSKLDLISCRNVMIYLEPTLQQQVFRVFHYSLKPTSFLLLGTSESVGESSNLFALVDKKSKLYSRKQAPTRPNLDFVTSNNLVTNVNPDDLRLAPTSSDLDPEKEAGSVNIPIVMLGNDLSIRRFTPMAEKVFNLIPTDVGRPLNHIKPNINVPNLEQFILDVIDTLVVKEQEVQDTEGHWYNILIRPYKTIENQIDGAVMVLVDIDALKRSTEQIKESRDYAEAIVETIPEPLVVLDANLRVNTANRCFYQTFQVSPTQTEHNTIFELGNGQWEIPQLRSLLEEVLPENNQIDNFEVEHVFEKIGRKTMLLHARKIQRTDDQQMILLVIQDITERKLFEEQRNQILTAEQSARSVAEVANRTKDEFLSIVSHELRNPLNSMLGWTQLLRNRRVDAAQTEHALSMVERSAKSQAKLIEDLLDISRITTGKLQLNVSAIALAPVIEAAINVARPSAEAKNIQIEALLEAETIEVSGDPDRLQQVIWNLLSNAIKFTPVGGRVTVKLSRTGEIAQIQVSDTGQGISADFLPYVFERFRQADSSRSRAQGGLGLGLSIVYQLVELHGGTVHAESPGEGQGTTMTVRLPLQALPTDRFLPGDLEQVESTTGLLVPLDSIQPLEGLRVLVVDDEAGILELLKTIVEQYGAEVTAVGSAKEAIAVLTANPGQHDVLLSDIGMPNEDGYALIRQVRALSAELGGQIPAAALTAYVRAEEERESLATGFQRHIAKPVEPAQLVSIIADLAGRN
jgi:two-component system CheB/CheR fusion protein